MFHKNSQIKNEFKTLWRVIRALSPTILKFQRIRDLIQCSYRIYSFRKCADGLVKGGLHARMLRNKRGISARVLHREWVGVKRMIFFQLRTS